MAGRSNEVNIIFRFLAPDVDQQVKRIGKRFDQFSRRVNDGSTLALGGFRRFERGVSRSVIRLRERLGLVVFGIGAITAAVNKFTGSAADFEKSLANVDTLLGPASQSIAKYREELLQLNQLTSKQLVDLTNGLYQAISGGIPAVEGMGGATAFLTKAQKAAVAGLSTTKQATDALLTAVNAYSVSGLKAAKASDLLFKTVVLGRTTFPELANSLGRVATVAASFGVTIEDLLGTVAGLTRAGLSTEEAMTAVRRVIVSIANPSAEVEQTIKSLNKAQSEATVEFGASALAAKGLIGVFEDLTKATGGDTDVLAKLFPNVRALVPATLAVGKGFAQLKKLVDGVADSAGATDAAFKKQESTFREVSGRLRSTLVTVMAEIGKELLPELLVVFNKLIVFLQSNQGAFQGFFKGLLTSLPRIGAFFSDAFGAVADTLKFVSDLLGPLVELFKSLSLNGALVGKAFATAFIVSSIVKFSTLLIGVSQQVKTIRQELSELPKAAADANLVLAATAVGKTAERDTRAQGVSELGRKEQGELAEIAQENSDKILQIRRRQSDKETAIEVTRQKKIRALDTVLRAEDVQATTDMRAEELAIEERAAKERLNLRAGEVGGGKGGGKAQQEIEQQAIDARTRAQISADKGLLESQRKREGAAQRIRKAEKAALARKQQITTALRTREDQVLETSAAKRLQVDNASAEAEIQIERERSRKILEIDAKEKAQRAQASGKVTDKGQKTAIKKAVDQAASARVRAEASAEKKILELRGVREKKIRSIENNAQNALLGARKEAAQLRAVESAADISRAEKKKALAKSVSEREIAIRQDQATRIAAIDAREKTKLGRLGGAKGIGGGAAQIAEKAQADRVKAREKADNKITKISRRSNKALTRIDEEANTAREKASKQAAVQVEGAVQARDKKRKKRAKRIATDLQKIEDKAAKAGAVARKKAFEDPALIAASKKSGATAGRGFVSGMKTGMTGLKRLMGSVLSAANFIGLFVAVAIPIGAAFAKAFSNVFSENVDLDVDEASLKKRLKDLQEERTSGSLVGGISRVAQGISLEEETQGAKNLLATFESVKAEIQRLAERGIEVKLTGTESLKEAQAVAKSGQEQFRVVQARQEARVQAGQALRIPGAAEPLTPEQATRVLAPEVVETESLAQEAKFLQEIEVAKQAILGLDREIVLARTEAKNAALDPIQLAQVGNLLREQASLNAQLAAGEKQAAEAQLQIENNLVEARAQGTDEQDAQRIAAENSVQASEDLARLQGELQVGLGRSEKIQKRVVTIREQALSLADQFLQTKDEELDADVEIDDLVRETLNRKDAQRVKDIKSSQELVKTLERTRNLSLLEKIRLETARQTLATLTQQAIQTVKQQREIADANKKRLELDDKRKKNAAKREAALRRLRKLQADAAKSIIDRLKAELKLTDEILAKQKLIQIADQRTAVSNQPGGALGPRLQEAGVGGGGALTDDRLAAIKALQELDAEGNRAARSLAAETLQIEIDGLMKKAAFREEERAGIIKKAELEQQEIKRRVAAELLVREARVKTDKRFLGGKNQAEAEAALNTLRVNSREEANLKIKASDEKVESSLLILAGDVAKLRLEASTKLLDKEQLVIDAKLKALEVSKAGTKVAQEQAKAITKMIADLPESERFEIDLAQGRVGEIEAFFRDTIPNLLEEGLKAADLEIVIKIVEEVAGDTPGRKDVGPQGVVAPQRRSFGGKARDFVTKTLPGITNIPLIGGALQTGVGAALQATLGDRGIELAGDIGTYLGETAKAGLELAGTAMLDLLSAGLDGILSNVGEVLGEMFNTILAPLDLLQVGISDALAAVGDPATTTQEGAIADKERAKETKSAQKDIDKDRDSQLKKLAAEAGVIDSASSNLSKAQLAQLKNTIGFREKALEIESRSDERSEELRLSAQEDERAAQDEFRDEQPASVLAEAVAQGKAVLQQLINELPGLIQMIFNEIISLLPTLIAGLADLFTQVLIQIAANAGPLLETLINAIIDALPVIIDAFVQALPVIIQALIQGVTLIISRLPEILAALLKGLIDLIGPLVIALTEEFPVLVEAIAKAIPELVAVVVEALPDIITAIIQAIPLIYIALVKAIPTLIRGFVAGLPALFRVIFESIGDMFELIGKLIADIFGGFKKLFTKDLWLEIFDGLGDFFLGIAEDFGNAVLELVGLGEDGPLTKVGEAGSFVVDLVTNPAKAAKKVEGAFDALTSLVASPFHSGGIVKRFHSGGIVRAQGGMSGLANSLRAAGSPGFQLGGEVPSLAAAAGRALAGAADDVPILAQVGEVVLRREAVQALGGPEAANGLNRGQLPNALQGGGDLQATVQILPSGSGLIDQLLAGLVQAVVVQLGRPGPLRTALDQGGVTPIGSRLVRGRT